MNIVDRYVLAMVGNIEHNSHGLTLLALSVNCIVMFNVSVRPNGECITWIYYAAEISTELIMLTS